MRVVLRSFGERIFRCVELVLTCRAGRESWEVLVECAIGGIPKAY
jgi:hypothetical protein